MCVCVSVDPFNLTQLSYRGRLLKHTFAADGEKCRQREIRLVHTFTRAKAEYSGGSIDLEPTFSRVHLRANKRLQNPFECVLRVCSPHPPTPHVRLIDCFRVCTWTGYSSFAEGRQINNRVENKKDIRPPLLRVKNDARSLERVRCSTQVYREAVNPRRLSFHFSVDNIMYGK